MPSSMFDLSCLVSPATATTRRCTCIWWTWWAPSSARETLYRRSCWTPCWSTWCQHTRYAHDVWLPVCLTGMMTQKATQSCVCVYIHTHIAPPWMLIQVEMAQWRTVWSEFILSVDWGQYHFPYPVIQWDPCRWEEVKQLKSLCINICGHLCLLQAV